MRAEGGSSRGELVSVPVVGVGSKVIPPGSHSSCGGRLQGRAGGETMAAGGGGGEWCYVWPYSSESILSSLWPVSKGLISLRQPVTSR